VCYLMVGPALGTSAKCPMVGTYFGKLKHSTIEYDLPSDAAPVQ
jgi:hypothetical protein